MTTLRTNDIGLASALTCISIPIKRMEREGSIVYFVFEDHNLDTYVERYWLGGLQIDAKAYYNQLKAIKSLLHQI